MNQQIPTDPCDFKQAMQSQKEILLALAWCIGIIAACFAAFYAIWFGTGFLTNAFGPLAVAWGIIGILAAIVVGIVFAPTINYLLCKFRRLAKP